MYGVLQKSYLSRSSDNLREKNQNFVGFSGENSREISGGNFPKKQSVKNSRFRWILFWQILLKSTQFSRQYDQCCLMFF